MSTLKDVVKRMPYKEFKAKVEENVVPTVEFKKCYKGAASSLTESEKRRLISLIVFNLGMKMSISEITNDDLNSFVIATSWRATFHK